MSNHKLTTRCDFGRTVIAAFTAVFIAKGMSLAAYNHEIVWAIALTIGSFFWTVGMWQWPTANAELTRPTGAKLKRSEEREMEWKTKLGDKLKENSESWEDVEANTMTEDEMMKKFDDGYGGIEGCPFTVWTKRAVYFPLCYDGAEWVGSVSRNPDGKPTNHQGGG